MTNFQATESNPWNPFSPTKRDLERTEQLSKKSPFAAGLLAFFFWPGALLYMNRGINSLKLIGYVFIAAMMVGLTVENEEVAEGIGAIVGYTGGIAIVAEQVNCVNQARQRNKNNKT